MWTEPCGSLLDMTLARAQTLNQLQANMRTCSLCQGLPLGAKPIFQLSANVRVLIAGQAPGRITHHKGIPFDDPSGDRLRQWLGVDRATFYGDDRIGLFPMGLCYPGTGKGGDHPPRPECAKAWRPEVLSHLTKLELTVVIGRYAINWHLPDLARDTVTGAVEKWRENGPATIVLPHPSPRNNLWLRKNPWFERDVIPQLQMRLDQCLGQDTG